MEAAAGDERADCTATQASLNVVQGLAAGLWNEKRGGSGQGHCDGEQTKNTGQSNLLGDRAERKGCKHCTTLAYSCRDAVRSSSHTCREYLTRQQKCRAVWTDACHQLRKPEYDH